MMYGAFMIMFCCNLLKMDGWFMLKHSEDEWIDFLRRGEKGWMVRLCRSIEERAGDG